MALQAQWGIEKTADSVISISSGLFKAATSDNVTPLAIMACERFGNTLAMCPETCRKLEKTVVPTPPHAVLKFIRGTVGYSANDCATYFGSSQAGLQFLGLATALGASMDTFRCTKLIHHMLDNSTGDKSMVPTLMQVEDLMESLVPRCRLSSFGDELVGWHCLLSKLVHQHDKKLDKYMASHRGAPSADSLKGVVDAFRELYRIGDSGAVRAVFTVSNLAPWLTTFTKWCLGSPPSIYLQDGTPILETADSNVRIHILNPEDERYIDVPLKATVIYAIGSPKDLATLKSSNEWVGMVKVRTYFQWLLRELNVDQGDALTAVRSAIGSAVKIAAANLSFVSFLECHYRDQKEGTSKHFQHLKMQPMLEPSHVLALVFGESESTRSDSSPVSILHIREVREYLKYDVQENGLLRILFKKEGHSNSEVETFLWALAEITASVLALSLFHHPDLLGVVTYRRRHWNADTGYLIKNVFRVLKTESKAQCDVRDLLTDAMIVIGHYQGRGTFDSRSVVMSSFGGQTVYFDFLEKNVIGKRGFMSLSWQPGVIWYDKEQYDIVHNTRSEAMLLGNDTPRLPVTQPLNLLKRKTVKWMVEKEGRRRGIRLSLSLIDRQEHFIGGEEKSSPEEAQLDSALDTLATSLIIERCPHDKDSNVEEGKAKGCGYWIPGNELTEGVDIHIAAVDGSDYLRRYSYASIEGKGAVFRGEACLSCCIELCRRAGLSFVIL
ncbi:hypothetical protein V2A60_004037 [Cordyceps javanica]